MPLENGLATFENCYASTRCPDEVLISFFNERNAIISALKSNQTLINNPYNYKLKRDIESAKIGRQIYTIPEFPDEGHPVYAEIIRSGLAVYAKELSFYDEWMNLLRSVKKFSDKQKMQYASTYALIDMSLYLVYILNIYEPNKALIHNIISTHTKTDTLGREIIIKTVSSLENLVNKSTSSIFPSSTASAILVIAKHDASQRNLSRKSFQGIDYERVCEDLLISDGFEVQTTPASGDFGADLVVGKDDLRYAIQCKDTSKPVGVKAVQEAVSARSHYGVDFAVVCASAGFTDAAIELATSNKVILCNADQLANRLNTV